jgi:mannosidase alpha-like ER degradation enhancer 2
MPRLKILHHRIVLLVFIFLAAATSYAFPEPDWIGSNKRDLEDLRGRVEKIFYHAYDNYMVHAFPRDELKPISCTAADNFGGYMLTLIDSLDTLAVLGNTSEFARAVNIISDRLDFDIDASISVFETNIRVRRPIHAP